MEYDKQLSKAITLFKKSNNKITVNEVVINGYEEYTKKLSTEFMAGNGPDVASFNTYVFNSMYKTMKSGIFCDLQPFINNDKEMDKSEFNKVVFDCGTIDGKRYVIPTSYYLQTILIPVDATKKTSVSINENDWTNKELVSSIDKYMAQKSDGSQDRFYFAGNLWSYYYLVSSNSGLIDYNKKETNFAKPETIDLIKHCKKIQKAVCTLEVMNKYKNMYYDLLNEDNIASISDIDLLNPFRLWAEKAIFRQVLNKDIKLYPFPTYNGKAEYTAVPNNLVAVNSKCVNKEKAYELVKILLSKDVQSVCDSLSGIPVNNQAVFEQLDKYKGKAGEGDSIGTVCGSVRTTSLSEEDVSSAKDIIKNINRCEFVDIDILKMAEDAINDFIKDKATAEQTAEKIDQKVKLYLNE